MANVQSPSFLIGNATVMLAPQGTDVFSLTPALHSVGMVKNVNLGVESDSIELRNGILQNLVDSKKSNVRMNVTFEGYEFSAANLYRALGYATGGVIQRKRGVLSTAVAAGGTSLSITSSPLPGETASAITAIGDIPAGSTLVIQKANEPDFVYPVRTVGAATGAGPYVATVAALPAGISFAAGDVVWVVNEMAVGDQKTEDFFCMKIAGTLSNHNVPLVLIFPKVKILRGFNLQFSETDYANLPFEISPYFLSATEATGRLAEIGTTVNGKAYIGA